MPRLAYPDTLPEPKVAPVHSAERRAMTQGEGALYARPRQRERLAFQSASWSFTSAQAETFQAWGETELLDWGAWFGAKWALPQGFATATRKFLGTPAWQHVATGVWRVTAEFEVRGAGLLPTLPAPPAAHFLDNFNGSEMSLFEHTPDDAPAGFAYLQPGFGEGLRLEGGRAVVGFGTGNTNNNSSNTAPSNWEPLRFPGGLRFELRGHASGGGGEYQPAARATLYADESAGQIELYGASGSGAMFGGFSIYGMGFSASGNSLDVPDGDFTAVLSIYPNGIVSLQFNDADLIVVQGIGDPAGLFNIASTYYELTNVSEEDSNFDMIEVSPVTGDPPDIPVEPGADLFYDEFAGSGFLVGHIPNVAPSGFEWLSGDPEGLSIAVGAAYNSGNGNYTASNSDGAWSVAPSEHWRTEMQVEAFPDGSPVVRAGWYLGGGDDLSGALLEVTGIEDSDPVQVLVRVHIAGEEFSQVFPAGDLAVRLDVHGGDATLFVNDAEVTTLSGDFSGFATITNVEVSADGTVDEMLIDSVRLTVLEPI